jgi:outer membrane protein OmpA-like peptidoglycan-associated protein
MNIHAKLALALVVLGTAAAAAWTWLAPRLADQAQLDSSDARGTRGRIAIGMDSWVGYFPLCSPEMKKRLRAEGWVLDCQDDRADYAQRLQRLQRGEIQLAVATVDAYLLAGGATAYPGTIVAVLDESKGGDAIVAWQDKISSLDALKSGPPRRVAFTPMSPSEHLLRSATVHFDIAPWRDPIGGSRRLHASGSGDALQKLQAREVEAAVLWEPDVTRALAQPGLVKLLGTRETQGLIVDVLLAQRGFSQTQPQALAAVLEQYFAVLRHYREQPQQLLADLQAHLQAQDTRLDAKQTQAMLDGVAWASLTDNAQRWLGTGPQGEGLLDTIASTLRILTQSGSLAGDPLPGGDAYRIINRHFVAQAYTAAGGGTGAGADPAPQPVAFRPLDEAAWNQLREVGTLKAVQVAFRSGAAELGPDGSAALEPLLESLKHYPRFRVLVKGHTGLAGDAEQNRRLSQERAQAVAAFLQSAHGIDPHRLRVLGLGAGAPPPRLPGESDRAYNYRLPRVELSLLAEVL